MPSLLVADCPRCGAKKMTFDLSKAHPLVAGMVPYVCEVFCICSNCNLTTVFSLCQKESRYTELIEKGLTNYNGAVNKFMNIVNYVSLKDHAIRKPPEHLPENIEAVFREGAACLSIECFNAASTMFRLCVDLSTKDKLPEEDKECLNNRVKQFLKPRLEWLFDKGILQNDLRDLSSCIKDDGDDAVHDGTLTKKDAEDLIDFTYTLLERIYTEPKKIQLAKERRSARHQPKS